jgi:hypothetical protein
VAFPMALTDRAAAQAVAELRTIQAAQANRAAAKLMREAADAGDRAAELDEQAVAACQAVPDTERECDQYWVVPPVGC